MAPTWGWEPSCEVPRTPYQNVFPEKQIRIKTIFYCSIGDGVYFVRKNNLLINILQYQGLKASNKIEFQKSPIYWAIKHLLSFHISQLEGVVMLYLSYHKRAYP